MKRVKVWDLPVRLVHGALPFLIAGLFLTGEHDSRISLHSSLGLAVLALVVARIAWGFWGGGHARFSDFVPSPARLVEYARGWVRGRPTRHLGHNPLGAVMVLVLLTVLLGATVSGVLLYAGPEWDGALAPLVPRGAGEGLEELHEGLSGVLPFLIVAHVAGVLISSVLERQNLPLGMVTGYKRAGSEDAAERPLRRSAGLILSVLLGVGVAAALGLLLPRTARAELPAAQQLLAAYEAEARGPEPTFSASAARGAELARTEHPGEAGPTSCVTCHGADPRSPGRSPAGKRIDPLSPAVAPARFSDRAMAEKWFGRNCKQVLGVPCTAAQKADFLAFVLAAGGAR